MKASGRRALTCLNQAPFSPTLTYPSNYSKSKGTNRYDDLNTELRIDHEVLVLVRPLERRIVT